MERSKKGLKKGKRRKEEGKEGGGQEGSLSLSTYYLYGEDLNISRTHLS